MPMTFPNRSLKVRCLPLLMTAIAAACASGTERAPAADLVLHNGHVSAPHIARFATLGVIASVQPPHAVEDKGCAETPVGADRIAGAYAWRTLRRAGDALVGGPGLLAPAVVAVGSDVHDRVAGLARDQLARFRSRI